MSSQPVLTLFPTCARCGAKVQADDRTDVAYWCGEHIKRRFLWQWGKRHNWRQLATGRYGIAPERGNWLFALAFGDDAMIEDLYVFIQMLERDDTA